MSCRAAIARHMAMTTMLAALAACGSTASVKFQTVSPSQTVVGQGCSILTRGDVTQVVGTDLGPGIATPGELDAPLGGCSYTNGAVTVSLLTYPTGLFHSTDPGASPVPGVGDQAWFVPQLSSQGFHLSVLYLQRGSTLAMIFIQPQSDPIQHWKDLERSLGGRVAPHLTN